MARSNNWRINKSSLMAVEGAQILKALQKVVGASGLPPGFQVKFSTKGSCSGIDIEGKEVIIGGGKLFEEAPMPADKFDVLVGLALHEVEHWKIETANVWRIANRKYADIGKDLPSNYEGTFRDFVNIGEDIVVESSLAANTNLVDYGDALFSWATYKMREANPNKLMELWIEYGLGHKADRLLNLPPEMDTPMSELVALTGWLRHSHSSRERAVAYTHYWNTLKDIILNPVEPPTPLTDPDFQDDNGTNTPADSSGEPSLAPASDTKPSGGSGDGEDESDSKPDSNNRQEQDEGLKPPLAPKPEDAIDNDLAKAIEDAVQSDSEDITDEVAEEFKNGTNNPSQTTHPVIRSRETKTPLIKPDPILCKRLGRVMTIRKRLQARIMHGEKYGRIDKRHLYRVGTDERVFNLKYKFPDGFPNTRILIDLSGSMSGRQADEVLQAAGALQTLVNAEVWCYDSSSTVNLVRVDEGKLVHQFQTGGNTPSGLAIVGVSLGMRRGGLVVHLTDGEHNSGQEPWNAHWILKKRGIELVNLIWGHDTKHYNYDGMNWRQLSGLAEFPDALYQILVEQTKLSSIGGR